jgi:hypothetical protein
MKHRFWVKSPFLGMPPLDPVHIGPFIRDPFSGEKKTIPVIKYNI